MDRQLGDVPGLDFLGIEEEIVAVEIGYDGVLGIQFHGESLAQKFQPGGEFPGVVQMLGRDADLQAQLVIGPRRRSGSFQIVQDMGDLMNQIGVLDLGGQGQIDMVRVGLPGLGGVDQDPGAAR